MSLATKCLYVSWRSFINSFVFDDAIKLRKQPASASFQGSFAENLAFLLEALKRGLKIQHFNIIILSLNKRVVYYLCVTHGVLFFLCPHQVIAAVAAPCCLSWMSSTCSPTIRTRRCSTTCLTSPSLRRLPSLWSASPADWWASTFQNKSAGVL